MISGMDINFFKVFNTFNIIMEISRNHKKFVHNNLCTTPTHLKCNLQDNKQILNYVFCWTFLAFSIQMFMFFQEFLFCSCTCSTFSTFFPNIHIFHILLLNFFLYIFLTFCQTTDVLKIREKSFRNKTNCCIWSDETWIFK